MQKWPPFVRATTFFSDTIFQVVNETNLCAQGQRKIRTIQMGMTQKALRPPANLLNLSYSPGEKVVVSGDFRKPLCKVGVVIIPASTSLVVNLTASSTPFRATHVYSSKSDSRMCDIRSSVLELITATRELSLTGNLPLYQIISGVGFPAA